MCARVMWSDKALGTRAGESARAGERESECVSKLAMRATDEWSVSSG